MSDGNFNYFFRNIARRHRISVRNDDDQEVWFTRASSLQMIVVALLTAVVIFVVALLLSANTGILNAVPGYTGNRDKELLVNHILRLDSLEREMQKMKVYTDNVSLIMEGRTPVIRTTKSGEDTIAVSKQVVPPSAEDSILRSQMEGDGRWALLKSAKNPDRFGNLELVTPVQGEPTERFDSSAGRLGVTVACADNSQVLAVQDGTVVMSVWNPESGYVVQIQHSDNLISTYRNLKASLCALGDRVRAGASIGSSGSSEGAKPVRFELWYNGVAVDPEKYIDFQHSVR